MSKKNMKLFIACWSSYSIYLFTYVYVIFNFFQKLKMNFNFFKNESVLVI